jgi:transposase
MNALLNKFEGIPQELLVYIRKLEARISELENVVKERDKAIIVIQDKYDSLEFNYSKLVREKYASKSEMFSEADELCKATNDSKILNEDNRYDVPDKLTSGLKAEINFKEPKTGKSIRKKLPLDFPRVVEVLDFDECEKQCECGGRLYKIDEFVKKLQYLPARLEVIQLRRPKYACRTCYESVKIKPLLKLPTPKSYAMPSVLAYTVVSKFCDHLPLFRHGEIWKRQNVEVMNRATMVNWMHRCGELLEPIVDFLKERIIASGYARKGLSYFWLFMPGEQHNPYIVFEYHPTRSGEVANEFFKNFTGYLQCDGYSGYNSLQLKDSVTVVGCLAHVRRKFVDIIKNTKKPGKVVEAIRFMQQLYQIERQAKEMHPIERKYFRELRAKPILKSFKYWLAATKKVAPPKSALGIAIGYALNQWEYLTNYLKDGRVSICNNWAENQIRPFVLGRKNWGHAFI